MQSYLRGSVIYLEIQDCRREVEAEVKPEAKYEVCGTPETSIKLRQTSIGGCKED